MADLSREHSFKLKSGFRLSTPDGWIAMTAGKIEAQQFAIEVARICEDDRAMDIVVLDLRSLSPVTDFFVICTGTSDRQIRAIVDHIHEYAKKIGNRRFGVSGYEVASWILADYVDVMVHVFADEQRRFYDLELMWGDAPRVDWARTASA